MDVDLMWAERFDRDIRFGYVGGDSAGPGHYNPRLVLNEGGRTVEHALLEELKRGGDFTFSVAFVTPGAVAQLKQHLRDHEGRGRIITSDYLGFNAPSAFAELLNLKEHLGIDVRLHKAKGFHPKGYMGLLHDQVTGWVTRPEWSARS
jgi:HKD family nuclease